MNLELRINGVYLNDQSTVDAVHSVTYPVNVLPYNRLQSIGQYLHGLGMTVSYPNPKKLHVEVDPSNLQIHYISFLVNTLQPEEDVEFSLEYAFRAN